MVFFSPTVGTISLVESSNKPFTAESTLITLTKLNRFMETTPLEKLGVKKDLILGTVPSILMDIATSGVESIDRLASLTYSVAYGGAALPLEVGDLLAEHGVNLSVGYGT